MNAHYTFACGCTFPLLSEDPLRCRLDVTPNNVRLDCPATWAMISDGNTKGCFQLESQLGQSWAKKVKPKNIEELSALIAIIRPGCLESMVEGKSLTRHYVDRKNGEEEVDYAHPALKDILNTYGILVYQEQAIKISQKIAGFSLEQADILRKCVAENSIVLTQNGPKYIQDLTTSTHKHQILTCDTNNMLVYKPLSKAWFSGQQTTYTVTTSNGYTLNATGNHQIFTQDGWKTITNLTTDDYIVVADKYRYKGSKSINTNLAKLLGYFISEGCWTPRDNSAIKITNKDPWIINDIKTILTHEFDSNSYSEYIHKNQCVDIFFKNEAREWIQSVYTASKAANKYIPQYILSSTHAITTAFLGAYFSGDGFVSLTNNQIGYSSTSPSICHMIQMLLLRDGIHTSYNIRHSTYKNQPYTVYETLCCSRPDIAKFDVKYRHIICPSKATAINTILSSPPKRAGYQPTLVPPCFIKAVMQGQNINAILGSSTLSGSVYNGPLTYDKTRRINQKIASPLLQDILDAQYKFVKVVKILEAGLQNTYDFTIDDDTPYAFINGLLVHNSIGKKDTELMQKTKKMFIEGGKQQGIMTDEELETTFDMIESSQRYSFNKSHSVSYAVNGYLSAYIKAHFPQEFFTSWLYYAKEKQKPQDEIHELVNNAKRMNITVLPPDLRYRNTHFKIIDKIIYFGLSDIRGIGGATISAIQSLIATTETSLGKCEKLWDWTAFLLYIAPKVNKSAIQNLIQVGALAFMELSRTRMMFEYNITTQLSPKEMTWLYDTYTQPQLIRRSTLTELLTLLCDSKVGKGGGVANKNRLKHVQGLLQTLRDPPYLLEDTPSYIAAVEEALLGIPLTYHQVDECDIRRANCTCKEFLLNKNRNVGIYIASCVDRIKEIRTINNKEMAFLTISDSSCSIESIVVFPEKWTQYREQIQQGKNILVCGTRGKDKSSLILEKVQEI